jgi:hypothetical protein
MSDKEAHERAVFEEFANAAHLLLERGSVGSEKPPKPDIRCRLSGHEYYFELARLVDPVLPKGAAESIRRLRKGDTRPVVTAASFQEPLIERTREKTANKYDTGDIPVDLLLYYDSEAPAFEFPPPGEFREWAEAYMVPEIQKSSGQFSSFWVFDRNEGQVLWRFESGAGGRAPKARTPRGP